MNWEAKAGRYSRLLAKMTGMTPAWLTLSGMYVDVPPNIFRPTIRRAYWTGMRRWACSMKMTAATMTRPIKMTRANTSQPRACRMLHRAPGKEATTDVKMRIDIPFPMPRSVMSSPNHMIIAVPAVMVITMMSIVVRLSSTRSDPWVVVPWKICPVRASATMPVDCRIASPRVRYRVYWVILAVPAWPSFLRVSSRGMTTVSSCRMMLAVMYGMIPSAKIVSCSSAPPENRLISP